MPTPSKIQQYTEDEFDFSALSQKAADILKTRPFRWQLEAARAILCGQDVLLDVGTGCGKSLCFKLALLLNDEDIAITVSPLTALMLDQANSSKLPTVAVCQETISWVGYEKLYEDIVNRKFREVIVSPEIILSKDFQRAVLSKTSFTDHARMLNIDEAHCINIWGGSFRPDYAELGLLRGRFARNINLQVASATFPDHVLDDIRIKLNLLKNLKIIRVTNERPNVALSVRTMIHPEESKADLRFLIPTTASSADDIKITLVYCNQRSVTEEGADCMREWAREEGLPSDCIAYYHALIGADRKREIESLLHEGKIRILFCTEALGMGCDLRNISRVILWGLPPTFCSLVQRAGRAGRDLETNGEAILIVPKSTLKESADEIAQAVRELVGIAAEESEALDREATDVEVLQTQAVLNREGVHVADSTESSEDAPPLPADPGPATRPMHHRKRFQQKNTNIHETRALLAFVRTKSCRRQPWNDFFQNEKKLPLTFGETTVYQKKPGQRCCDNCQPDLFKIERVTSSRVEPGLKRGKKKKVTSEEAGYIRNKLRTWRDTILMEKYYGSLTSLGPSTLIDDESIEAIATCGERVQDYGELRKHVRWGIGHNRQTDKPSEWGELLMEKLGEIYSALEQYEREEENRERETAATHKAAEAAANYRRNTETFHVTTLAEEIVRQEEYENVEFDEVLTTESAIFKKKRVNQ